MTVFLPKGSYLLAAVASSVFLVVLQPFALLGIFVCVIVTLAIFIWKRRRCISDPIPVPLVFTLCLNMLPRGSFSLDVDTLLQLAAKKLGRAQLTLDDLGPDRDGFAPYLRATLRAVEENPDISTTWRMCFQGEVVMRFTQRFLIEQTLAVHGPAITAQRLVRPLVIVGLPRTGTTLLLNLLAQDPIHVPLIGYECYRPALPPPYFHDPVAVHGPDPRLVQTESDYSDLFTYLMPDSWHAVHPTTPNRPDECLPLLSRSFFEPVDNGTGVFQSMDTWAEQPGAAEHVRQVYAYYKLQLQLLQWQHEQVRNAVAHAQPRPPARLQAQAAEPRAPAAQNLSRRGSAPAPVLVAIAVHGSKTEAEAEPEPQARGAGRCEERRLLLKCPVHLEALEQLLAALPDACLVWTHRRAAEVVPSYASLIAHFRTLMNEAGSLSAGALGREWQQRLHDLLNRGLAARDRIEASRGASSSPFCDVLYEDLMHRPMHVIARIYAHCGLTLTADVERRMHEYLRANPKDKAGVHKYSLGDFGLHEGEINAKFRSYESRFLRTSE